VEVNPNLLGYAGATLTTGAFVPQAIKIMRSRDTRAISLSMYLIFTLGVLLWFCYGVALKSWPIMIANAITFALAAIILALKVRHG
jgi:MtN3 and saliva related transmembrane protein